MLMVKQRYKYGCRYVYSSIYRYWIEDYPMYERISNFSSSCFSVLREFSDSWFSRKKLIWHDTHQWFRKEQWWARNRPFYIEQSMCPDSHPSKPALLMSCLHFLPDWFQAMNIRIIVIRIILHSQVLGTSQPPIWLLSILHITQPCNWFNVQLSLWPLKPTYFLVKMKVRGIRKRQGCSCAWSLNVDIIWCCFCNFVSPEEGEVLD